MLAASVAPSQAGAGSDLHGLVLDNGSSPVVGALVEVFDDATFVLLANFTTGADGAFRIPLPDGIYEMNVTPTWGSGLYNATIHDVEVSGETPFDITLIPLPIVVPPEPEPVEHTVTGTVVDHAGVPLANQHVALYDPARSSYADTTHTAANGSFSLEAEPGNYSFQVTLRSADAGGRTPDGFVAAAIELAGNVSTAFVIPSATFTLQVVDQAGQPVPGTSVQVGGGGPGIDIFGVGDGASSFHASGTTGADGNVTLLMLAATSGSGEATPPAAVASAATTFGVDLLDGSASTIVLDDKVHLTGTFRNATLAPIPGQNLILRGPQIADAVSDETGAFDLAVRPGEYLYRVSTTQPPSDDRTEGHSLNLTTDQTLDFVVPSVRIALLVQDEAGTPVPGASVRVTTYSDVELLRGVTFQQYSVRDLVTNGTGHASWDSLPTTTVYASAEPPEGHASAPGLLDASTWDGTSPLVLTLPDPVRLSGRFLDHAGEGLQGQKLLMVGPMVAMNWSAAGGAYEVLAAPGIYTLYVEGHAEDAGGRAPEFASGFLVGELNLTTDLEQDLTLPSVLLTVRVQDTDGDPVPDASVYVPSTLADDFELFPGGTYTNAQTGAWGVTDADGEVGLVLLPTTSISLQATPPGRSDTVSRSGINATADVLVTMVVAADEDLDGIADDFDECPGSDDLEDIDDDVLPDGCDHLFQIVESANATSYRARPLAVDHEPGDEVHLVLDTGTDGGGDVLRSATARMAAYAGELDGFAVTVITSLAGPGEAPPEVDVDDLARRTDALVTLFIEVQVEGTLDLVAVEDANEVLSELRLAFEVPASHFTDNNLTPGGASLHIYDLGSYTDSIALDDPVLDDRGTESTDDDAWVYTVTITEFSDYAFSAPSTGSSATSSGGGGSGKPTPPSPSAPVAPALDPALDPGLQPVTNPATAPAAPTTGPSGRSADPDAGGGEAGSSRAGRWVVPSLLAAAGLAVALGLSRAPVLGAAGRRAVVHIEVRRADGRPAPGAEVEVWGPRGAVLALVTDASGYAQARLPRGEHIFVARLPASRGDSGGGATAAATARLAIGAGRNDVVLREGMPGPDLVPAAA